jgi:integrase
VSKSQGSQGRRSGATPGRRKPGEGSVFRRADGRWAAVIEVPRGLDGKRRRKTVYGSSLEEVLRRKHEVERQVDSHLPVPDERRTTAEFLDWWLAEVLPGTVRPRTVQGYRFVVRRYIVPSCGTIPLARLGPEHVLRMLREMESRGLSIRTRIYTRSTLRRALNLALKWGWVHRNVAALVDSPGTPRPKVDDTMTLDEARQLLAATEGDRLQAMWVLILALGLRKGEALALRWDVVDLEEGTLRVEASLDRVAGEGLVVGAPKTDRSRRTVYLPGTAIAALRAHRARQAAERLRRGRCGGTKAGCSPRTSGRLSTRGT